MSKTQVWSCGGGTQSIAIAALIILGLLPKPDWAVIVDTEREKPTTWEYMDEILVPELAKAGVTLHRVRKSDYATVDIWSLKGDTILLPVFTNESGSVGKLTNYCSGEWKKRVRTRFLREQGVKDECAWIGYSLDESARALRMMGGKEYQSGKIRMPLIHDVPMRRHNCESLILKRMGWPPPPRSACSECPNQSDPEWLDTKINRPEEFARAVALDYEIREKDPHAFLHKSCLPLDQVDLDERPGLFAEGCDSGLCFI